MSKHAFDKIMQGVEEARAFLDGTADKSRYRVHFRPRNPTLDKMGPGMDSKVYRPCGCTRRVGIKRPPPD
jgi:hypothetical protein